MHVAESEAKILRFLAFGHSSGFLCLPFVESFLMHVAASEVCYIICKFELANNIANLAFSHVHEQNYILLMIPQMEAREGQKSTQKPKTSGFWLLGTLSVLLFLHISSELANNIANLACSHMP